MAQEPALLLMLTVLLMASCVNAKQSPATANSWASILPASTSSTSITSRAQAQPLEAAAAASATSLRGRRLARMKYTGPIEVKDDDAARDRADANQTATVLFRGGDVMYNPVTVHFIWVGDWVDAQKTVVKTFVDSISGGGKGVTVPKWWAINTQYYGNNGKHVTNKVTRGREASVARPRGRTTFPTSTSVGNVVTDVLQKGLLPVDENAVYAVLGDASTTQTGLPGNPTARFCVNFCGWHSYVTVNGKLVKFTFTANAGKTCPFACISQRLASFQFKPPNGDIGIDGLVSIFAHELAEATCDPQLRTWFDDQGNENADKCQYIYGKTYNTADGAGFNLVGVKNSNYLIQQNWDEKSQSCQTIMK